MLWLCTLITLILSIGFYSAYFANTLDADSPQISALLYWLFILFIVSVSTGLVFSFFYYIRYWKNNPKKAWRSIVILSLWAILLLSTWLLGDGNPLPLIGYKGSENTYVWLKITDMWLYAIYIMTGLGFLALIGGILWSYFKKFN